MAKGSMVGTKKRKTVSSRSAKKAVSEIIQVRYFHFLGWCVYQTSLFSSQNASHRGSRRPFVELGGGLYSREDFYTPTQCLGPECVYEARPGSKYCSEECGVQLALK